MTHNRRQFFATGATWLLGIAGGEFMTGSTLPKRARSIGGHLTLGTRYQAKGLDSHRFDQGRTDSPMAMIYSGLTGVDHLGSIRPDLAEWYEPNQNLTNWTFRLRRDLRFHNGREVNAQGIKENFLRLKSIALDTDWRDGMAHIERIGILDQYTLRFNLRFKVRVEPLFSSQRKARLQNGAFNAYVSHHAYQADPDQFYRRYFHSESPASKRLSGWYNARFDHLVEAGKTSMDQSKRKALYTEAMQIINRELPAFHLHEVTSTIVAVKAFKGFEPNQVSNLNYPGGGIRTGHFEP